MKFLVIGDPHFKRNNVEDSLLLIEKTYEIALREAPDYIVCLGDILHTHETIHVGPFNRAIKWIEMMTNICHVYLIIGNHDRPNNSTYLTDEHPFTALKSWKNISVVDNVQTLNAENMLFLFVPYVFPGRFDEAIKTETDDICKYKAVFAHQEIRNAKMGAVRSVCGDVWPLNYPMLISGHIHDYDQLQENVIYTGTPMQHAFGDRDDKTISLFIFNEKIQHIRISLNIPKKQILYMTPKELRDFVISGDNNYKIVVRGTLGEIMVVRNTDHVKEISKKIVIVYKIIDEDQLASSTKDLSVEIPNFSKLLSEEVKKNPGALRAYLTIYPTKKRIIIKKI